MKKSAYILFIAAALAAGCRKPVPDALEVSADTSVISNFGSSAKVTLSANNPVSISSDASWLSANPSTWTPTDTQSETTILVTGARNESDDVRTATLTFTAGSLTKTLSFTQDERGLINADHEAVYELESEGGELTIEVTTNLECEVSVTGNWLTYVETKAPVVKGFTFTATANEKFSERNATVTFSYRDVTETVTVTQKGSFSEISYVTENGTAKAPVFGQKISHGNVDWGDGQTSTYYQSLTHSYSDDLSSHTVSAHVDKCTQAGISGISGVTRIDFTKL